MSTQLVLFAPPQPRKARSYVIQGQERPVDLPRLEEGAETMQARVLEWFERQGVGRPRTPTGCALGMDLKLTTVRPRITQLLKAGHLEHCKWIPRRPTEDGGSEGWYRYVPGELVPAKEGNQ